MNVDQLLSVFQSVKGVSLLKGRSAFSLIEMSIVLVIISLVTAGGLTIGQSVTKRAEYQITDDKLDEIVKSLEYFYRTHSRIPCPASRTLKFGDTEFGREIIWDGAGDSCANDTTAPAGTARVETSGGSGIYMRIGALPTRDLEMQDPMMHDDFNNRFTYAVIEGFTDDTTFAAATGALTVNDGTGTDLGTDRAFVIISHGDDARGAYTFKAGAIGATCGSDTQRDVENCNEDATFTDSLYNTGDVESKFFDDRIRWMTKNSLTSAASSSGSSSPITISSSSDETGYTGTVHSAVLAAANTGKEVVLVCTRSGYTRSRYFTVHNATTTEYLPISGTNTSNCDTATGDCNSSGTSGCTSGWKIYSR